MRFRGGWHHVYGAPTGFDQLTIEGKIVKVVSKVGQTSNESCRARIRLRIGATCQIAWSLWVFPQAIPCQEDPEMVSIGLA